jgi:hypothetical protein
MNQLRNCSPRDEQFGYECGRCSKCCHGKLIQVNPYEIGRLARCLGQTTTEFRAAWTDGGAGNYLRRGTDGACVFLGPDGCTVYADRPLVCRIYPLGRHVAADGTERWSHLAPYPESAGVYTREGTIADFLASHEAELFLRAADQYTHWVRRAAEALCADSASLGTEGDGVPTNLADMDSTIVAHCAAMGRAEPSNLEARKDLHLEILHQRLDEVRGGSYGRKQTESAELSEVLGNGG